MAAKNILTEEILHYNRVSEKHPDWNKHLIP